VTLPVGGTTPLADFVERLAEFCRSLADFEIG
jgi:hypothetical protein